MQDLESIGALVGLVVAAVIATGAAVKSAIAAQRGLHINGQNNQTLAEIFVQLKRVNASLAQVSSQLESISEEIRHHAQQTIRSIESRRRRRR